MKVVRRCEEDVKVDVITNDTFYGMMIYVAICDDPRKVDWGENEYVSGPARTGEWKNLSVTSTKNVKCVVEPREKIRMKVPFMGEPGDPYLGGNWISSSVENVLIWSIPNNYKEESELFGYIYVEIGIKPGKTEQITFSFKGKGAKPASFSFSLESLV